MHNLNFVAIDFETANPNPYSACQLGLTVVRSGEVVEQQSWLICPPDNWFRFTYIHGITWRQVADRPDFARLWPTIRPYLADNLLAAHNARFDMGVLSGLLQYYDLERLKLNVADSVAIARRAWPQLADHRLPTVAAYLNISLDHHEAASDAHACAKILCRAELEQRGSVKAAVRSYVCGG